MKIIKKHDNTPQRNPHEGVPLSTLIFKDNLISLKNS